MIKLSRTCLILLLSTLSFVKLCLADADPLGEIKLEVRERFPSVEQISVDRFSQDYLPDNKHGAEVLLLDVREAKEFEVSHLKGAALATDLSMALNVLQGQDRSAPIVVYCSVGYRSSQLAGELAEAGFTNIRNLEGSIFEWAEKRLPLVNAQGATLKVHPYDWWYQKYVEPELRAWKPE